jgi:hypothetical protein
MTPDPVRTVIVAGLEQGACYALRNNGWTEDFLVGRRDVAFEEMDIDSLAIMELCIAIEVELGVSILPDEMAEFTTLGAVAASVKAQLA